MGTALRIKEIDILSEAEKERLLLDWNRTVTAYPRDRTIVEIFQQQVSSAPDHPAIIEGKRSLSYRELNARADRMAQMLLDKGAERGSRVGIMAGRNIEMVIGTLAILKAGCAYLPIDPNYPADRIAYLLEDGGAGLVLTGTEGLDKLPGHCEAVLLDGGSLPDRRESFPEEERTPESGVHAGSRPKTAHLGATGADLSGVGGSARPEDPAYVMYTSGTTGKPKGVEVTHRNIIRLVKNTNYVELNAETRMLQTGAIVFDATTFEMWGTLLNGGSLYLIPSDDLLDASVLEETIRTCSINTMWLTSPLFNQLAERNPAMFRTLRYLLVGGDVLSPRHINRVLEQSPGLIVINGYGPTENTTFSTTLSITGRTSEKIAIGRPIANSTAYILDKHGKLQPIGVPGELCVGGDGLARGYLNRPELTAEKFVPHPFIPGERIYRTGDMARWLRDGTIEFLGRMDHMVKIRGFRIELGEIENRMLAHPQIKEAVLIAREREGRADKELCGYYSALLPVAGKELKKFLALELPDYMIPAYLVQLDELPLNQNGKVDRRKLPEPEEHAEAVMEYTEPRSEAEQTLAELWTRLLGRPRIGVDDHFYDLGGNSLVATLLSANIQMKFGVRFPLSLISAHPVLEDMAAKIAESEPERTAYIRPAPAKERYVASPQQARLYIEQKMNENATHYHIRLKAALPPGTDPDKLEKAFRTLISRHESLRTNFHDENNEVYQQIQKHAELELIRYRAANLSSDEDFNRPFDLGSAPLMRARIVTGRSDDDGSELQIVVHHIVTDGFSLAQLFKELQALYRDELLLIPELPGRRS